MLRRLRRMGPREIAWRVAERARIQAHRVRATIARPRWRRRSLAGRLVAIDDHIANAIHALRRRDWRTAHRALNDHFQTRSPRFVLHPSARDRIRSRVLAGRSNASATQLAERIVSGSYDLLGYHDLRFDTEGVIDWHVDPVSGRRAPRVFWADVRYLSRTVGDHKVIWELNRHQEWLLLGRAYWLTGDERFRETFTCQLASWLEANPPGIGINWASALEVALRSMSWLWALEFFSGAGADDDRPWIVDLLMGVDRQLRHVEQHLSRFFSPNTHLLGEALALYVCGRALPELARSAQWAQVGREVLLAETTRQILPDGVHAEQSSHYHRYTLEFYLLALAIARITGDGVTSDRLQPTVTSLAEFMRDVSDAEGRYPLIGDDDGGELVPVSGRACADARVVLGWASALLNRPDLAIEVEPEAVLWLTAVNQDTAQAELKFGATAGVAPNLGSADECGRGIGASTIAGAEAAAQRPSAGYPAAGYFISRHGRSHLVFDAGRHGFLNGGHAHADALALTLVANGRPLFVDGGTATYTMDRCQRDYFRSSQAHNTLTLDGRSQAQPSDPFHWRTMAHARPGRIAINPRFDYFEGVTDAYAPLEHERSILSVDDNVWVVADRVRGSGQHDAMVHWHLHPDWQASPDGRGGIRLAAPGDVRAQLNVLGATIEMLRGIEGGPAGWVSPVYGRTVPTTTLRCHVRRPAPFAVMTCVHAKAGQYTCSARLVEVLSANERDDPLAVVADVGNVLELTLFGSRSQETRTVILDPRRALTITTDARLLHARVNATGSLERVCAVDCSILRFEGAQMVTLLSTDPFSDIDVEIGPDNAQRVESSGSLQDVSVTVEPGESREPEQDASRVPRQIAAHR
jgi:hypothetical protein